MPVFGRQQRCVPNVPGPQPATEAVREGDDYRAAPVRRAGNDAEQVGLGGSEAQRRPRMLVSGLRAMLREAPAEARPRATQA